MGIAICAFNSIEMNDEELVKDELNLFVKWELSDMFNDLILRREFLYEHAELDQIGKIIDVDVEPIYAMSFYWDKAAEAESLSALNDEAGKAKQQAIIQTINESLIGNLDLVLQTVVYMEDKLAGIDNLEELIIQSNDGFFDNHTYFKKSVKEYECNILADIKKMKEFLVFAKSLGADTSYFKFKPNF